MAKMPSNIDRFKPSSTGLRTRPELVGTTVTTDQQLSQADRLSPLLKEPEDARLTGGTRSLARRLLALNLAGSRAKSALPKSAPRPELVRSGPTSDRGIPPLHTAVA